MLPPIDISVSPDYNVQLSFHEAYTPTRAPIRADIWIETYKLISEEQVISDFLFSKNHFLLADKQWLILEAYTNITKPKEFNTMDDLACSLYAFDFNTKQQALVSKVVGGDFEVEGIEDNEIIYKKSYSGYSKMQSVDMDSLQWEDWDKAQPQKSVLKKITKHIFKSK